MRPPTSTSGFSYATVTGTSADRWGTIVQIPGTKIGSAYGKLYDNSIYCNGLNSKQTDYYYNTYSGSKNYFFSLVPQNAELRSFPATICSPARPASTTCTTCRTTSWGEHLRGEQLPGQHAPTSAPAPPSRSPTAARAPGRWWASLS